MVYCITIYGEVGFHTEKQHRPFVRYGFFMVFLHMEAFDTTDNETVAAFMRNRLFDITFIVGADGAK